MVLDVGEVEGGGAYSKIDQEYMLDLAGMLKPCETK